MTCLSELAVTLFTMALCLFAHLLLQFFLIHSSLQKNGQGSPTSEAKWAVACSAVTFAVTALVVLAHLHAVASTLIVGTKLEGVIVIIMTAFWAATVSIVTNASNGLGVSEDTTNQVLNGNLYYFSWAGFVTAIILLVNYLRSAFGVDVVGEVRDRGARLTMWAAMLAAALVVCGSSARVLNEDCGDDFDEKAYCKRTKFAVSLGAIGIVFALIVVGLKMFSSAAPFMVEFAIAIMLTVMNAFGVAYITSAKGPGSAIGNLYYFSWISFLSAAFLAADCFNQFTGGAPVTASTANGNGPSEEDKDIEVETFDEQI